MTVIPPLRTAPMTPSFALVLLLGAIGCSGHGHDNATDAVSDEPASAAAEIDYEPAYPAEVSTEALTDHDTAQQPHDDDAGHSHADGSHTHDDDDGEEHSHEASDDDHQH